MKCRTCGVPLPSKGLSCNYCGTLNWLNGYILEREVVIPSPYHCPLCHEEMERLMEDASLLLEHCPQCDGVFMSEELLEEVVEYYKDSATLSNQQRRQFVIDNPRDNRKAMGYYPCPICSEMMQPFNYKRRSGVILELCEADGIWLDGGELFQICEWHLVESIRNG